MENLSNKNKDNWEARSANYQNNIKSVLYKSFPDSLNNHIHNWHKKIIFENIPNKNNLKILDLGCGYGRNALSLIERNSNIEITGVDISENFVKQFIENTGQKGIVCSLEDLPDNTGEYDYIICIAVLMYVEKTNIEIVIKKLLSQLNTDGKIIFIEPSVSGQPFLNGFGLLSRYNSKRKTTGGNSFTTQDLKESITSAGGIIGGENRLSFTTIFIIPLYLMALIFGNKIMTFVFKIVEKLDSFLNKVKLPTINISLIVKSK